MKDEQKLEEIKEMLEEACGEWKRIKRIRDAAPEMLEALKAAVSQVHLKGGASAMSPEVRGVFDQCVDAIAKAEGRS